MLFCPDQLRNSAYLNLRSVLKLLNGFLLLRLPEMSDQRTICIPSWRRHRHFETLRYHDTSTSNSTTASTKLNTDTEPAAISIRFGRFGVGQDRRNRKAPERASLPCPRRPLWRPRAGRPQGTRRRRTWVSRTRSLRRTAQPGIKLSVQTEADRRKVRCTRTVSVSRNSTMHLSSAYCLSFPGLPSFPTVNQFRFWMEMIHRSFRTCSF